MILSRYNIGTTSGTIRIYEYTGNKGTKISYIKDVALCYSIKVII